MTTPTPTLSGLLTGVSGAQVRGDATLAIANVRDDSRRCEPGDLFIAVPGVAADGRRFITDAATRGAIAIVVQKSDEDGDVVDFAGTVVTVPNVRRALGIIAANRYRAAHSLALLAVTGTNGKTTTSYIVEQMLRAAGKAAGLFGTVSYRAVGLPGRPAPLTTPGALMLHEILAEMRAVGTTDVVLEATSHALEQGRLDGCLFRVAALTNVTQDHLDYHATMARYFDAKALLFERLIDPARGTAVTFLDDDHGLRMRARAIAPAVLGIARAPGIPGADVVVERHTLAADGTRATIATPAGRIEIASPLVGEFNLSNLALAVGMAVAHGLPAEAIATGAAAVAVPGRLERVANARGVLCVVDYAHTPDALARAIATMRPLVAPGRRLLVVFGCGGDRDRGKRPLMGEIAARDADLAFVTSDNPRTESPDAIVGMILDGVRRAETTELDAGSLREAPRGYHVAVDRRTAIQRAGGAAQAGDVLLVAGKGHEDYQILGTTKIHFDDREEAAAALAAAGANDA